MEQIAKHMVHSGYTRAVVTVKELLNHGSIGLGTFEDVNGEMIVVNGACYRATEDGTVYKADPDMGVPFAAVAEICDDRAFGIETETDITGIKELLTLKIEEVFGLNSMHMARIDGEFEVVQARSESAYHAIHVSLKDMLSETQKSFRFDNVKGSLVCVYYPDYMDGINASGWHLHFVSDDRKKGGHVFELEMNSGKAEMIKINCIEIQLPESPAFDTYSLKNASGEDIKKVEQGE